VTMRATPDRDEVIEMLAGLGNRETAQIRERVDSMELAWLVHQVEQRYGVSLALSDESLARMSTVDGAVEVLREELP